MDFFEAQDRARRRTGRLVVLFGLAVLGTIAALYLAFVGITALVNLRATANGGSLEHYPEAMRGLSAIDWWQPGALKAVTLLVLPTVALSALSKWWDLRAGGPAVAHMVGGREISPSTTDLRERTLLNVVEEMALASGLAAPAVFILPDESAINAFAAGYSPADAAIGVTRGALERLDRDELQGVVAHEFSHILNGDMRLNTRLTALLFGILAVGVMGRTLLRLVGNFRVSGSSGRGKDGGGGLGLVLVAAGLALLIIGTFGHLFGKLIQAAVSRQREFLADAAAVQFTRNPAGIGNALKKLGGAALAGHLQTPGASEISHFCFAQNFRSSFGGLFATHPPLATRIRAIDPAFDGRYLESRVTPSSLAGGSPWHPAGATGAAEGASHLFAAPAAANPASLPSDTAGIDPARLIDAAGQLSSAAVAAARAFMAEVPEIFREAVHDPARVPALCFALCLPHGATAATLEPLLALIARHADPAAARRAAELHLALAPVPSTHHLPLLQLAAPALRRLEPADAATLLDTLQALVHADGALTPHEFALQKIVSRTLGLAASPRDALQVLSPGDVAGELSLALSTAARIEAADETAAARAFARAAMEFNGLQPPLAYRPEGPADVDELDLALDHLAHTPAPFRKRVLLAFAAALTADSRLTQAEADMLRAFAAALDCPLPPVLPVSA
jgi:Zn-dependent protease with chaperone function